MTNTQEREGSTVNPEVLRRIREGSVVEVVGKFRNKQKYVEDFMNKLLCFFVRFALKKLYERALWK